MPRYSWLLENELNTDSLPARIAALRRVGVPYPEGYEAGAFAELEAQSLQIQSNLTEGMVEADSDKEIIALIAYLQRLGTDIKVTNEEEADQ